MTLDEIIMKALDHCDQFEFYAARSTAKNKDKLALRRLKRLRDFLNQADLDAFKVD